MMKEKSICLNTDPREWSTMAGWDNIITQTVNGCSRLLTLVMHQWFISVDIPLVFKWEWVGWLCTKAALRAAPMQVSCAQFDIKDLMIFFPPSLRVMESKRVPFIKQKSLSRTAAHQWDLPLHDFSTYLYHLEAEGKTHFVQMWAQAASLEVCRFDASSPIDVSSYHLSVNMCKFKYAVVKHYGSQFFKLPLPVSRDSEGVD